MAGSEEQAPSMNTAQLVTLIRQAGRKPVERGTLYNVIRDYTDTDLKDIGLNPLLN
jgi:aminodeoxyfutalosine synthase